MEEDGATPGGDSQIRDDDNDGSDISDGSETFDGSETSERSSQVNSSSTEEVDHFNDGLPFYKGFPACGGRSEGNLPCSAFGTLDIVYSYVAAAIKAYNPELLASLQRGHWIGTIGEACDIVELLQEAGSKKLSLDDTIEINHTQSYDLLKCSMKSFSSWLAQFSWYLNTDTVDPGIHFCNICAHNIHECSMDTRCLLHTPLRHGWLGLEVGDSPGCHGRHATIDGVPVCMQGNPAHPYRIGVLDVASHWKGAYREDIHRSAEWLAAWMAFLALVQLRFNDDKAICANFGGQSFFGSRRTSCSLLDSNYSVYYDLFSRKVFQAPRVDVYGPRKAFMRLSDEYGPQRRTVGMDARALLNSRVANLVQAVEHRSLEILPECNLKK